MEIDTQILFQLIGELEVLKRVQSAEIVALKAQVEELQREPTPITKPQENPSG